MSTRELLEGGGKDLSVAVFSALLSLAKALHKKGILRTQEFAQEIEATAAFVQGTQDAKQEIHLMIAAKLRELGEAIDGGHGQHAE